MAWNGQSLGVTIRIHVQSAAAMNQLELSSSPPAASVVRKRETNTPCVLPPVRELSRLIADIRRARAALDAAGTPDEPVRLEHVVGNDPRD